MNDSALGSHADLDILFALARMRRPDTSATEYAFETRLLARLRVERETGSAWAMVSWRLIPFFAACVAALTLWHSQIVTETNEAEQMTYVESPVSFNTWNSIN